MNMPQSCHLDECRAVTEAITSRRSVRAFLPDPVPHSILERILTVAARAPSGSNIQPWHVDVMTGATLTAVKTAITMRFDDDDPGEESYQYYPDPWREPYLARRRATGWGLYGALNIARHERDKMRAQHRRNFAFFDAPVGLIFSIDHDLPLGSWLDCGMFLQNVMIAARAFDLHTCPQQAFALYGRTIREKLGLSDNRMLICGMALGKIDATDPANGFETTRLTVDQFARFHE